MASSSNRQVPRFWCPLGGSYAIDADGYLADPETRAEAAAEETRIRGTAELAPYRCLVLLGEPGAGKTSAVTTNAPLLPPDAEPMQLVSRDLGIYSSEGRVIADLLEGADIERWRNTDRELCLVIDSFDEAQTRIPNLARLLSHYLSQWPTDRLYLRITCRTAEWPQTLADRLAEAFVDVGTFELLPLRKRDIAAFLPRRIDAAAFVDEVLRAHAVPLALRPLTLNLLVRLFDRGFPERAADLYAGGLLALCDEQNPQRRDAGAIGRLSPDERLAVARRIAAVSIFGGRPAIWTGPVSKGDDTRVNVDDCVGGAEPRDAQAVELTAAAVRESQQTALFTGRGPQQLGWAHATFPDYLAAEWVTRNGLTQGQTRTLFFSSDGRIFPQLRHAAAWAVGVAPDRHGWMAEKDPQSFLDQVDIPDNTLREVVVTGLLNVAADGRLQTEFTTSYQGLAHPNLAEQLRPRLRDEHPAVRRLATRTAEDCGVGDLVPDLTAIALDPTAGIYDRVSAAWAVKEITPETDVLLPLVKDPAVLGDDPDDELLGTALLASWPHALSTSEALAAARVPKRSNLLGSYGSFLGTVGRGLTDDDLPATLEWLESAGEAADDERLADLFAGTIQLAIRHLDDERALRVVRDVARRRGRKFRRLIDEDGIGQTPVEIPTQDRRRLALSVLDDAGDDLVFALVDFGHGLGLITATDLRWLVDQYAATPERRPALARLIRLTYRIDDLEHVNTILDLPADHPFVIDVVGDWLGPVELNSERARRLREEWELITDRPSRRAQTIDDSEVNQWIASQIDTALAGDPAGFWQAARLVTVRPGTRHYHAEFQPDLTAHPRWQQVGPDLKDRILQAATLYLRAGRCDPDRWLGQQISYFPAQAGYRALILLARLDPAALATLESSVWREWAPIIIGWTVTVNGARWDDKALLLSHARTHASSELCEALVRIMSASAERGENLFVRPECKALWCEQLAEALISLAQQPMPPTPRKDLLEIIVQNDPERARPLLLSWLKPAARAENADRAKQAAQLLLAYDTATAWATLYQLLLDDPEFGKDFVLAAASSDRLGGPPGMLPRQLADLYLWLAEYFPRAEDPRIEEAHHVGPREEVAHWRDSIPEVLRRLGTAEAVEATRRIADASPSDPWLRLNVAAAEEALRSASWTPVVPAQLYQLAADHRTRLVRSATDLLQTTVIALETIQRRLQADTPEAQLLWDTRIRRPKTEDEASDYLRQRLNDLLGGHGVVVNREVQVRRIRPAGIPERTDLRIDAAADFPYADEAPVLTIVGEVKAAWNPDLMTAMRSQLVNRYMVDIGTKHGLYITLWFDTDWWAPDQGQSDRDRVAHLDRVSVLRQLRDQAREFAADGFHIEVAMLDMSYERPVPTTGTEP